MLLRSGVAFTHSAGWENRSDDRKIRGLKIAVAIRTLDSFPEGGFHVQPRGTGARATEGEVRQRASGFVAADDRRVV